MVIAHFRAVHRHDETLILNGSGLGEKMEMRYAGKAPCCGNEENLRSPGYGEAHPFRHAQLKAGDDAAVYLIECKEKIVISRFKEVFLLTYGK